MSTATAAKTGISDAPPTSRQTFPLPPGTAPFAQMAAAYNLTVVDLADTAITVVTVEGHEDDLAAFADRLEQLSRLCR